MAKGNLSNDESGEASNSNSMTSTPSSSLGKRAAAAHRSKPYDANNSFVKKVATKMTDLIPQRSWISKWFNNSQGESELQNAEEEESQIKPFEEKDSHQPPLKRPCIRMDIVHPPGTFAIKPRKRNITNPPETSKEQFSNHNDTTQDFLEPTTSGRLHRFVASTPAFPSVNTNKPSDSRPTLNILMSEQNNGATNGVDDNSESSESTSGCSSLIPQNNRQEVPGNANYSSSFSSKRRLIDDKFSFTNHLQSPRSLFLDSTSRETLGSRQPSFNPLMMSNNSTLQRSSSLSSPFYAGNTMFGGANAANMYRSNSVLSEPPSYQVTKRTNVQVNTSSDSSKNDLSGMSQTARRILEALDQFSSPLSDAKKIPIRNVMDGKNDSTMTPQSSRKRAREEETNSPKVGLRHLTRELVVPTVPDMLRMRRRQKLQNTTLNARKIMTRSAAAAPPPSQEYRLRTESDPEPTKRTTQLKAKKKTNLEEEETIEAVNLPSVPLQISSLPRFDISLPQCTKPAVSENKPLQQPLSHMRQSAKSDKDTPRDAFKFASPIKLADGTKNVESINNFTFSKPMSPSKITSNVSLNESYELSKTLSIDSNDSITSVPSFPNFIWAGPSSTLKAKEKKPKEESPKGFKVASELKEGSIMDFFAKQPISDDSSNVWECNECLIKNNSKETYCVACKSAKPGTSKAESVQSDSSDDIEIIECPNDKPEPKLKKQQWGDSNLNSSKSTKSISSSPSIFGKSSVNFQPSTTKSSMFNSPKTNATDEKSKSDTSIITAPLTSIAMKTNSEASTSSPLNTFKPVKPSWECPCCMVRNTETVTTCPCCNTAKPGSVNVNPKNTKETIAAPTATITSGFGDKFKKPEGSWSCDTCMVQNKADDSKCLACETPRPGAAKTNTTTLSSLSTSSSTLSGSGFGDKFKKPEGSWTCDSCMLSNKSDATKCVACETAKPGGSEMTKSTSKLQFNVDMPANAGSFNFGIDKADDSAKAAATSTLSKTNGFSFGSSSSSQTPSGGFSFGIPSADNKKDTDVVKSSTSEGFAFKSNVPVTAAATFQFGAKPVTETKDKEDEKKPTSTATFSFGAAPKTESEKITTTGFIFGSPTNVNATTDKKPEEKSETKALTAGFTFGAQPATTSTTLTTSTAAKNSITDKETKSTSDTTPANNLSFLFGSSKPTFGVPSADTTKKLEETKSEDLKLELSKTVPTFGAPTTEPAKPAAPTFSFGAPSTTSNANVTPATSSMFVFSGQPKAVSDAPSSTTALPSFGSPAAPKPTFSFGKPAETTPATVTSQEQQLTEKKPALSFGSTATPSFGSTTNQTTPSLFGNINTTPSAAPTLGSTDNKPLMFGAPENKIASTFGGSESKISTFGASAASSTPAASVFPSATPNTAATPAPLSFGSTFGSSTPSAFGSNATPGIFTTKSTEITQPTQGLFTFGQSSQSTAPTSSGFNFNAGSNATANSEQKNLFSFGTTSNTQVGNGFGSSTFSSLPASRPATAPPTFGFNAAPKTDVAPVTGFGQPTTTPMFNAPNPVGQTAAAPPAYPGTANPAPTTGGFNFGSTSVPTSFNFGSTSAAPSGGFNFNAPNSGAAPITFDPNVQPSFNFTAGSGAPTAFNAPPGVTAGRKIKKAVRRMLPRQ